MNRERVRKFLQKFQFRDLFIEEMGWSNSTSSRPVSFNVEGQTFTRTPIAQLSGVQVFEIVPIPSDAKLRAKVHAEIEKTAHENLLIFLNDDKNRTQSLWYWVKREKNKRFPREHIYLKDQPGDLFLSKLDGLVVEMNEFRADGTVPLVAVTQKLASSLDIERVTRKFYNEFSSLRVEFIDYIQGIDKDSDRFWYASVLLNRLMFIYFLQKKGFIQNNTHYLENKLEQNRAKGKDDYYRKFLYILFFQGFAKPADQRSSDVKALLGEIKYLNGGLFLPHRLEDTYSEIQIPDIAFENVFNLFGKYSWHLDDTPGALDDEINPDVLGYIFEKYINQKAFGAYYTRPEITNYLCERTIHAVIVARINANSLRPYANMGEILLKLDADLCRRLLDILKTLSILDPACGSGAFLVAAMKTLLDIYAAIFGKIRFLNDTNLTWELKKAEAHPSINYYIRKTIITDNLYGVDIMEEATEIARLRLFLFLVSSANTVDDLEPLPNIDFNVMKGNSLIGLLTVDEKRFNSKGQMTLFGGQQAQQYRALLEEKNRLIQNYRGTAETLQDTMDLKSLREEIETAKTNAYAVLNEILRDDFATLGIQYEQAQANGKTRKRPIELSDIEHLDPFHWGYEFDEIMGVRGGFDIIIANPPWETFKPQAKEFFAEYSDTITKNKMTIKDFEKELESLLKDPKVVQAWAEYQSRFPYVSAYYRSTAQFANQISVVNGKKAGTDINLYKLFTEQCYNLLRTGGDCGIVIPSGIYTDLGAKQLREMLFAHTEITGLFGFENRKTIFEGVDSRFKFVVMTYRKGGKTERFPTAFMRHDVAELEVFPNEESLQMTVANIRKLAPDSLSIPEFKSETDIYIAEKISQFPLLGEELEGKWNVKFGAEFHMTNDSQLFKTTPATGRLPLYEGKMIHQFNHRWGEPKYWLDEAEARKALLGRTKDTGQTLNYQRYRLGFRDVAASTNERTMIMTVLPPNVFCPHTMPVEKEDSNLDAKSRLVVCALMDSFVVDSILRKSVTNHLTFFFLYQLSVPRLTVGERFFDALALRAAKLICTTPEFDDLAKEVGLGSHKAGVTNDIERGKLRAEIDGMVAHLYGLTETEFAHILTTFPLVPEPTKMAALNAFKDISMGYVKP